MTVHKIIGGLIFVFACASILGFLLDGKDPIIGTTLTQSLSKTATTMTVASTSGFPTGGDVLYVDDEIMSYTGKTATTFTGLKRGQQDTKPASHSSGKFVYNETAGVLNKSVAYSATQSATRGGSINIPTQPLDFITKVIPKAFLADYSFLEGDLAYIKFIVLVPIWALVLYSVISVFAIGFQGVLKLVTG